MDQLVRFTTTSTYIGLSALLWAGTGPALGQEQASAATQNPPARSAEQKRELAKRLEGKAAEMEGLKDRAGAVTKRLADLAASGKLPTSDEAIKLMQQMVQEMAQIRESLAKIQGEVDGIKSWIGGQEQTSTTLAKDVQTLKKTKPSAYVQFQYRDTNQEGGSTDAFSLRRVRVGATHVVDPKASFKWSFDLATGTNQTSGQLRDAILTYDVEPNRRERPGFQILAGQQPLPLGYELARSSSEREFPERALYNQRMFGGERSRGVQLRYGIGKDTWAHLGGWNALGVNDPEQSSLGPGPGNRLGVSAGVRYSGRNMEAGISHFSAERSSFATGSGSATVTHPTTDRKFTYLDANVRNVLVPGLSLRGEAMFGEDRVPVTGTPGTPRAGADMSGYQLQLGYDINRRNQINVRYEQFDPNVDISGNAVVGYGVAYVHQLSPGTKLTAAHEVFDDAARTSQQRYHVTTIRVQFKF